MSPPLRESHSIEDLFKATETLREATGNLNGLQGETAHVASELEALNKESLKFDPTRFQNEAVVKSGKGFPQEKGMKPFLSSAAFSQLPADMPKKHRELNILAVRSDEFLWSSSSIDRGLHLLPSVIYDPTARSGNGGWTRNADVTRFQSTTAEKQWEILYKHHNDWYYYGTYTCVGNSSIDTEEAQTICPKMARSCLNKVVIHEEQTPPIIHRFISTLSGHGPFTFDCFGFERIGYDHSFYDVLLSRKKALQQMSSKSKKASKQIPSEPKKPPNRSSAKRSKEQKKKRLRDGQGSNEGPPKKKQKKS
ncbi:hypothetical protein DICSQDRAFT_164444 [Dichomitus squalens LYAD-421 SS1]|uniref:uncharacterized protein n=1 Tax=Dichomitus squalens (strain LYAD-421) TaxID=732165 RepID=UPI0004415470|nr:uncharacterized protein DICSQDRAFT_164444 [Dichomitus squalens LYAD-421 SS1]EJF66604.1 hypothetical protein DICSQDRAFT_164444 [Dichomitus squalens LYAD-421 SS1]